MLPFAFLSLRKICGDVEDSKLKRQIHVSIAVHNMNMKRIFHLSIPILILIVEGVCSDSIVPMSYIDQMELLLFGNSYTYYSFSDKISAEVEVKGPGRLTVITRLLFPPKARTQEGYHLTVIRNNDIEDVYLFSTSPSSRAAFKNCTDFQPGRPKKIVLSVPKGTHLFSFLLKKPEDSIAAAHFVVTKAWDWRLTASLTNTYDDNIYRYSPQDIDDFIHHRADYRFRMETYDDLVSSPSLTLYVTRRFSQNVRARLRLKYCFNIFAFNHEKNYQTISSLLRVTILKRSYLQFGYFHLPKFLIRPYWDKDIFTTSSGNPDTYQKCDFTRNLYSVKYGRQISNFLRGAVFYEGDVLYYNAHFTEYDTKANSFGFEILTDFTSWLQTGFEYAFKKAEAEGYDEVGETKGSSDDSDISYDEDSFEGKLNLDASQHISVPVHFSFQYRRSIRCFATEKSPEEDPFHAGRRDDIHHLSWMAEYKILRKLSLLGQYEIHMRDVSSKEKERITEVKNYNRNRITLGIEFTY